MNALAALTTDGAPLAGLDVAFDHRRYDWNDTAALAALLPEIFAPQYRYTGAALSHTLGAIIGGALPPVVSPLLLASYGGWAVSVMMGALGLVSLVCVLALPETAGRRI